MAKPRSLSRPYRVTDGGRFRLADTSPGDTAGVASPAAARVALRAGVKRLAEQQDLLWPQNRWAVLLIVQAMDAAGKDGTIKHVMTGVNPQGVQVTTFRAPSAEELDHDFLWRAARALPERGRIGIFNRSYYEEMLVVRVHPDLLERQHLPPACLGPRLWRQRFRDVVNFEKYLHHNGVVVRKFFLHVSPEEQRRRFLARIDDPRKQWKFSLGDVREREHWDAYQEAYEDMIRHTATERAPWYVVPADHKWVARLIVADAVAETLESLDLHHPGVDATKRRELTEARAALEAELGERAPAPTRRHGSARDVRS
ncbi:MAG TPA: polyphosphate kinase 2 family protein [Gemmatimonadaceae bacterium]|nr:polyphosphate kinase 2 family protein [Gemmatimonadaceae bacterium]